MAGAAAYSSSVTWLPHVRRFPNLDRVPAATARWTSARRSRWSSSR